MFKKAFYGWESELDATQLINSGVGPLCRGLKRHVQQSRAQGNRGGPSGVGSAGHSALGFTARRVSHSQVGAQGAHGGKPGFRALCLK